MMHERGTVETCIADLLKLKELTKQICTVCKTTVQLTGTGIRIANCFFLCFDWTLVL
jgi:hypothetical protein